MKAKMIVRHTVVFLWFAWMIFGVPAVLFYTLLWGWIIFALVGYFRLMV